MSMKKATPGQASTLKMLEIAAPTPIHVSGPKEGCPPRSHYERLVKNGWAARRGHGYTITREGRDALTMASEREHVQGI
jgi:hypothetical protein